jgi:hypothetical protein
MANNAKNPSVEIVKEMFGDHPEDVISSIKCAADTLGWLEEIFITIKNEALVERNGYRIKQLAEAGAYLALDVSNYAGYQHETYTKRLQAAGVAPASAGVGHE